MSTSTFLARLSTGASVVALTLAAFGLSARPVLAQQATATPRPASSVPTPVIDVVAVIPGEQVTINASNFPPDRAVIALMGRNGTLGVNGLQVGDTNSGSGTFTMTVPIPDEFKTTFIIAVRVQTTNGGWHAYDFFYNAETVSISGALSKGTPRIDTGVVEVGESVQLTGSNFPPGESIQIKIGKNGTLGINGKLVGTVVSDANGGFTTTVNIPTELAKDGILSIRAEARFGFNAYDWFYNR